MAGSKYILGERIAQGGMAEIYLGKIIGAEGFARICAFKKILPQFSTDIEFIQMFKQEAEVAKQLQNKNIVQVHDFVNESGQGAMLVMEYVDGQDLRSILREVERARQRIPVELAAHICSEILLGLAYAHTAIDYSGRSLGIIHRDVSPQNVLISYEGDIKITDFGIAKVQSSANATRAGVLKGKFRYMSPEQASGQPVDARTDVFAVGIILYEMLTMSRLFKGDDDMQILNAVRECKIRSPNGVRGTQVPPELETIIFKLLSRDLKGRYASARDAAKDLTRFLYAFKPDFFPGEVADFMQKLFGPKIETTRERIRSTLALPIDNLRQTNFSDGHGGIADNPLAASLPPQWPMPPPQGPSPIVASPSPTFSIPPQAASSGHVSLAPSFAASNDNANLAPRKSNTNAGVVGRPARSPQMRPVLRPVQRPAPRSALPVLLVALVLLAFVALGLALAVKKKVINISSTVELTPGLNGKGAKILLNGEPLSHEQCKQIPCTIFLSAGNDYVITAQKKGFKDQVLPMKIPYFPPQNRKETISFEGAGPLGNLQILTTPDGAYIVLDDGQFEGNSGEILSWIPLGYTYKLTILHPKCAPYEDKIDLPTSLGNTILKKHFNLNRCN